MSIPTNPNGDREGQACDPWSQQEHIFHSWSVTHRLSKTVFFCVILCCKLRYVCIHYKLLWITFWYRHTHLRCRTWRLNLCLVWDFVQIVEDSFQIIDTTVMELGEEKKFNDILQVALALWSIMHLFIILNDMRSSSCIWWDPKVAWNNYLWVCVCVCVGFSWEINHYWLKGIILY